MPVAPNAIARSAPGCPHSCERRGASPGAPLHELVEGLELPGLLRGFVAVQHPSDDLGRRLDARRPLPPSPYGLRNGRNSALLGEWRLSLSLRSLGVTPRLL